MKLRGDLPTVLLPIETATRELDSKLVLACFLATCGCRTIVGHKESAARISNLSRRVIWQGKDAFSLVSGEHFVDSLGGRQSAAMFIQDEGGIFYSRAWEHSVLTKHRADFIRDRHLARLCVWGERQKRVLAAYGVERKGTPMAVTGSPRFDLCSPRYAWIKDPAVAAAIARRRAFILMCTRFTSAVHREGQDRIFRPPDVLVMKDVEDLRLSAWNRDVHDFADYVVLVKEMAAAYPDLDIVVRPHPSENPVFYRHVFLQIPNVTVTNEGSVLDWIRAAELVVHSNCTTGVEAVLAGRRVLNMRPMAVSRGDLDKEVAKEAGISADSVRDALDKAGQLLNTPVEPQAWSADAAAMVSNFTADSVPMVADETLKVFGEAGISSSDVTLPPRRSLREEVSRWIRGGTAGQSYVGAKRGRLEPSHIEKFVDSYAAKVGGRPIVRYCASEYAVIEPA